MLCGSVRLCLYYTSNRSLNDELDLLRVRAREGQRAFARYPKSVASPESLLRSEKIFAPRGNPPLRLRTDKSGRSRYFIIYL